MSTSLFRANCRLPMASLGADSALPLLGRSRVKVPETGDVLPAENLVGQPRTLLPYHAQDGYDRELVERELTTIVLENAWLRATFLPELGGRLISLVDRVADTELLHCPEAVQYGNLGLRNAWFAGGVEWNFGTTGHWPLTCEPVHAAEVEAPDGMPVLRMWEYERLRGLVWRIDAWLPEDSPVLLVRPLIANTRDGPAQIYWWSNIAVPQQEWTRVIVPATEALHFGYTGRLKRVAMPHRDDHDASYPSRAAQSADYFFDAAPKMAAGSEAPNGPEAGDGTDSSGPWVAALDAGGRGLGQASTRRLRGRKLFVWGTSAGGEHWQQWLGGRQRYCEIQAGLAQTQLEHLPLSPGEQWSWTEAYGGLAADPGLVHGGWGDAVNSVQQAVNAAMPLELLDNAESAARGWQDRPPVRLLFTGSGWGALEVRAGHLDPDPATPFDDTTLGEDQQPWLALLADGRLPALDRPVPGVRGSGWLQRLERILKNSPAGGWQDWYQLGLLRLAEDDLVGGRAALMASSAVEETPWALRNLAELDRLAGETDRAATRLRAAHALAPRQPAIAVEAATMLLEAGRAADAIRLVDELDPALRSLGRIRLLECRAAVETGDFDRAHSLLEQGIEVPDLLEGEESFDLVWSRYQRGTGGHAPLPSWYDFRMHTSSGSGKGSAEGPIVQRSPSR